MKAVFVILIALIFCGTVLAKDHSADYQVGTLIETTSVRDINVFGSALANASTAFGHNIHTVQTKDGVYAIASPTSTGASILMAMATDNQAPVDIHIKWFMDDMHPGDKVLFYAKCNKHNDCTFYLPKPDKVGKEFLTNGHFYPTIAQTNTTQLCGTGKLSAAIETQVCKSATEKPISSIVPTPTDAPTDSSTNVNEKYPPTAQSQTDPRIEQLRKMCNSNMFKPGRDDLAIQQCGIMFPSNPSVPPPTN
jgi:hypothetical protein